MYGYIGRYVMRTQKNMDIHELKIIKNRMRRARQLRFRLIVAACALVVILSSLLGYTSFMSKASEASETESTKVYLSVMIPYGSTLESLSNEYMDPAHYESTESYIKEVKFINHLNDDKIIAGHYLILPYYKYD